MKLTRKAAALAMIGVMAVAGTALWYSHHPIVSRAHAVVQTEAARSATTVTLPDFSTIVERYGPAVVNISTAGVVNAAEAEQGVPFGEDPFFEFFRGLPIPHGEIPSHGQGSGFIISPDGVILTNAHVVRDAKEVTVKLNDRREFTAKVLGIDTATDVAVIKIDATNLPVVRLGSPARVRVGEWVLAIGSPFGFENSVTAGIVSGKGRSLPGDSYVPFIQTDVAVNPGNSGGPLFNANGEVVGINSQIYTRSGGYQGLSFAIPIDLVVKVKDQIVAKGHATHARLGVTIQDVGQRLADSFGLKKPAGALVASVVPSSGAAKAGLKAGDVIVKYNDTPIVASSDLPALINLATPGQQATLQVWRGGSTRDVSVTLDDAGTQASASADESAQAASSKLGLSVRPLTPDERREANVDGGLMVEEVHGSAAMAGVQPGDIVISLNGTPLKSVEQLRALVGKAPRNVALLVQRGDVKIFVPVHIG